MNNLSRNKTISFAVNFINFLRESFLYKILAPTNCKAKCNERKAAQIGFAQKTRV